MKKWSWESFLGDCVFLGLGCAFLAFAITTILKPNGLISGGATGASIVLAQLTGIDYTLIFYALSLIILVSAIAFLGKAEGFKIIFLTVTFPLILIAFDALHLEFIEDDLFLATIYFGLFAGVGVGLILKRGYSMGGTETVAKILHRRLFSFMSMSQILLMIDVIIISSSLFIFDKRIALYGCVAQFILIKVIDMIIFGMGSKKIKIEIISDANEEIAAHIIHEIKRGISMYEIKGGYTNQKKLKVVSICSPRESMLIRRFIAQKDPDAFVSVLPVSSVWGKGVGFDSLNEEGM